MEVNHELYYKQFLRIGEVRRNEPKKKKRELNQKSDMRWVQRIFALFVLLVLTQRHKKTRESHRSFVVLPMRSIWLATKLLFNANKKTDSLRLGLHDATTDGPFIRCKQLQTESLWLWSGYTLFPLLIFC